MPGKGSKAASTPPPTGAPTAPAKEPTKCDYCGKALGVNWFSLENRAYCSSCFKSQFWTPFQSVPDKAA